MQEDMTIRASAAPWWGGVELLVRTTDKKSVGTDILLGEYRPEEITKPTCFIDMDAAQVLMDDLWRSGIRPTEGAGSAGAMRAVEKHCDDLRKIAFKALEIE